MAYTTSDSTMYRLLLMIPTVPFLIIIGALLIGSDKQTTTDQPTLLRSGFEYVNGQGYFVGVVQNTTDRAFGYAHVELAFTDKSGRILSTAIERLGNMEPAAMRRFEVQLPSGASGARLLRVVAY